MKTERLLLYFHTVRYLRLGQIVYQLYYRLARTRVIRQALAPVNELSQRSWRGPWVAPLVRPRSHLGKGVFEFLGERGQVVSAADWNTKEKSKLWLYHLHYLDDLNAVDADIRAAQQTWLVQCWIEDNPPLSGNGWEPYTLSLRLVNLVKWCARQSQIPAHWLASMARQAQALAALEERHIMANHLFANGKALVFIGAFLTGKPGSRWLKRGLNILDREVGEQFLADGGHFELSPMYHSILLWDLCDLVNLADRSGVPELLERVPAWRGVIERGLAWLECMCHPDGDIAFFNDAAFSSAPSLKEIKAYANCLGCSFAEQRRQPLSYVHLVNTGYIAVQLAQGGKALLDVAEVGPSYQPGHAHSDTLSFELSLFGRRVLVNSGISQYGEDTERQRQRSTAAHNTAEINGKDSSEVWAGFRVARRARPVAPKIWEADGRLLVRCAHDGYRRLPGAPVHQRQWAFSKDGLLIVDTLSGCFQNAIARFYLHPAIQIAGHQELCLPEGHKIRWSVTGGQVQIVPSTWHPEFGVAVPNYCIEIPFDGSEVAINFSWE